MTFICRFDVEESVARIQAMCYQEETGYTTSDYFIHPSQNVAQHKLPGKLNNTLSSSFDIDIDSRTQMVDWCFQVIDFCKFHHETVEIAMSYLDRFMLSPVGGNALRNRSYFQLACMTALYTAVKIHEHEAIDPNLVSKLSRGLFTIQEIEAMEVTMLNSLKWRVNPPTSLSFIREFIQILPNDVFPILEETTNNMEQLHELIRLQIDMTVRDYRFIDVKPSQRAYCAFMNGMETLFGENEQVIGYIGCIVAESIGIDCNSCSMIQVQGQMYESVQPTNNMIKCTFSPVRNSSRKGVTRSISPRSIFGFS